MEGYFLEMRGITKRFGDLVANDSIDLAIKEGEILALLGENGAGKTTLMNILYGMYEMDSGEILVRGRRVNIRSPHDAASLGIGMVHQRFMLIPDFTVVENVALGLRQEGDLGPMLHLGPVAKKIESISRQHGLAVNPTAKVDNLSMGARQRVEIIKLLVRDARLLVLDEPTAVLTPGEVGTLFTFLRSLTCQGHAIIFITHKMNEVMELSDRVTVLRDGKVIGTKRTAETNPEELARMMVGREVLFRLQKEALPPQRDVALRVENLQALDSDGLPVLRGVSFHIREGEILGIAGVDGNGQAELAEVLAGLREPTQGRIFFGSDEVTRTSVADRRAKGMAYVPADLRRVGCVEALDIARNAILGRPGDFVSRGGFLSARKVCLHADTVVKGYNVRPANIRLAAGKLSGGNLQKLVLGRELIRKPRILVVEQPTKGLDVGATEYVRSQILRARREGAAILLISTELEEVLSLSDRIAVMYEGEIVGTVRSDEADVQRIGLMMAGSAREALAG